MLVSQPKLPLPTCLTLSLKYSVLLPPALKIVSLSTASAMDIFVLNIPNCTHWFCLILVLAIKGRLSFLTSIFPDPGSVWYMLNAHRIFFNFLNFWLHWVSVVVRRLSLVAESGGCSSLWCAGFSLRWLLLLCSTDSRRRGFSSCGTRAQ